MFKVSPIMEFLVMRFFGFLILLIPTGALRIGAFNIQTFGTTKYGDETDMRYIKQILRRYDVVLVQEIKDVSGVVIPGVLEMLRSENEKWEVVYSERLGRGASYKEQYAYYYRTNMLNASSTFQYDDSLDDEFEREPFGVLFESPYTRGLERFGLLGVHIKPGDAVAEINALPSVFKKAAEYWEIEDIMVMGDLNAECGYVNIQELSDLTLRTDSSYLWLIGDHVDTTVSSTDCAYDRMIATGDVLKASLNVSTASAFRFHEVYDLEAAVASGVSDHYPVEVEIPSERREMTAGQAAETTAGSCVLKLTALMTLGMLV